MGGHGALTLFLSTNGKYKSASAFAPICNPMKAPWGTKAFSNYLKGGIDEGAKYDASHLLEGAEGRPGINILVDYVRPGCANRDQRRSPNAGFG